MLLQVPTIASPFPVSSISIIQSSFRNNLVYGDVGKGSTVDHGHGSGWNVKETMYSAMGEYLERMTQRKPSHKLKEEFLNAYNINRECIEKIQIENILLFDPHIFNPNFKNSWDDSTGTAFHTNSLKLIESSFFEFIERQSLVFNWLTKKSGRKIKLEQYYNIKKIRNMSLSLKAYFDKFDLFEISIHPSCQVVITIGAGSIYKTVGLGVGWNLSDAIYSSLKESLQCVSHLIPPHQPDIRPAFLKSLENQELPESDMYYDRYFNSLSPQEMLKEYSYLYEPNLELNEFKVNKKKPSYDEYISIMKNISKDLSIELVICFIPSIIENLPGTVIRIIGKGAFPHIRTDFLDPFSYSINGINKLANADIPNKGRMVPFN